MLTFLTTLFVLLAADGQTPPVSADAALPAVQPTPPAGPAWLARVNAGPAGAFAPPRPFHAFYRVSWSDVEAARAEVNCRRSEDGTRIVSKMTGATLGLARTLYQVDFTHLAAADIQSLRPVNLDQTEVESKKRKSAHVEFTSAGAERTLEIISKKEDPAHTPRPGKRTFAYPGMFDLQSTLLYIRSLPLAAGDHHTLVTMTAGNAYLTTIKVVGRGTVKTVAGRYPTIECCLGLTKINKRGDLEPHKGFKSARAWLSDDADRLIVKAEAQVFIGKVTLDLTRVNFGGE